MTRIKSAPETLRWSGQTDGHLVLVDQTLLPVELATIECHDVETVWEAIKSLRVRGAPAIGIAAAYAVTLGLQTVGDDEDSTILRAAYGMYRLPGDQPSHGRESVLGAGSIERRRPQRCAGRPLAEVRAALLAEARAIHEEDRAVCHAIGRFGAELLGDNSGVLTHCNAGGLATAEYGTALSVFFTAQDQNKQLHVFVDETRPLLQGARLTAWELQQRGIDRR